MNRPAYIGYINSFTLCRGCGCTRGNHRWHDWACPGGKKIRRGFSAWRTSKFHPALRPAYVHARFWAEGPYWTQAA